jgi:hypothetical protein
MSLVRVQGNAGGTGTVTIASPNTNSDYTQTLSAVNGTIPVAQSNTALVTGVPIYENTKNVTTTYSITSGSCAMSTGPITLNAGVTVTLPSGSRWIVL